MGSSSLIPKTGGRRSIDNIVVPRELLRIVREKEHDFLLFWHSEVKKKAEITARKSCPYVYDHIARKCKNMKNIAKNNH